jgi:hypothetical protein
LWLKKSQVRAEPILPEIVGEGLPMDTDGVAKGFAHGFVSVAASRDRPIIVCPLEWLK